MGHKTGIFQDMTSEVSYAKRTGRYYPRIPGVGGALLAAVMDRTTARASPDYTMEERKPFLIKYNVNTTERGPDHPVSKQLLPSWQEKLHRSSRSVMGHKPIERADREPIERAETIQREWPISPVWGQRPVEHNKWISSGQGAEPRRPIDGKDDE